MYVSALSIMVEITYGLTSVWLVLQQLGVAARVRLYLRSGIFTREPAFISSFTLGI